MNPAATQSKRASKTPDGSGATSSPQHKRRKVEIEEVKEDAVDDDNVHGDEDEDSEDDEDDSDGDGDDEDESNSDMFDQMFGDDEDEDDEDDEGDEDDEERETEVETHTLQLSPSVTLNIKLAISDSAESIPGVNSLHAVVTNAADDSQVGLLVAHLIHRDNGGFRAEFYERMERESQDTCELAFELFDRYGCLKEDFVQHPVRKGTGVWDADLSLGPILVVEIIRVDKSFRRRGVCKRMMELIIEKVKAKEVQWVFAWPTQLNSDEDAAKQPLAWQRNQDVAEAFFRSQGFRRVGLSNWFCYAMKPTHRSHTISPEEDFDPVRLPDEEGDRPTDEQMNEKFPLHHAVKSMEKEPLLTFLENNLARTVTYWTAINEKGDTILHLAAQRSLVEIIQWIRKKLGKVLDLVRNYEGYTPLEALKAKLDESRVSKYKALMRVHISDVFDGFPIDSVRSLQALQDNGQRFTASEVKQFTYGCTCGQCLGGFLSPRMKYLLVAHAEIMYDTAHDHLEDEEDYGFVPYALENPYLSDTMKSRLSKKSFRWGYLETLTRISSCLKTGLVPNQENVSSMLAMDDDRNLYTRYSRRPGSKLITLNFLGPNGTVADVLRVLFGSVEEQADYVGDGMFFWVMFDERNPFRDEHNLLPKCRNDAEYRFVAAHCGIKDEIPIMDQGLHFLFQSLGFGFGR